MISFGILKKYQHSWHHSNPGEWRIRVVPGRMLREFPDELKVTEDRLYSTMQDIATRHLDLLHEKFMHYFQNEMRDTEHIGWVQNPFEVDSQNCLFLVKMSQN